MDSLMSREQLLRDAVRTVSLFSISPSLRPQRRTSGNKSSGFINSSHSWRHHQSKAFFFFGCTDKYVFFISCKCKPILVWWTDFCLTLWTHKHSICAFHIWDFHILVGMQKRSINLFLMSSVNVCAIPPISQDGTTQQNRLARTQAYQLMARINLHGDGPFPKILWVNLDRMRQICHHLWWKSPLWKKVSSDNTVIVL